MRLTSEWPMLVLCGLGLASQARALDASGPNAAELQARRDDVAILAAEGNYGALATAAMLSRWAQPNVPSPSQLLARAEQLAPERPELPWLELSLRVPAV